MSVKLHFSSLFLVLFHNLKFLRFRDTHRKDWGRRNGRNLLPDIRYETRPGHRLFSVKIFSSIPEEKSGIVPRIGHDNFLSDPFHVIMHRLPYHPTPYALCDTSTFIK